MTVSTYTVTPSYDVIGRSTGKTIGIGLGYTLTQSITYSGALPSAVRYVSHSVNVEYRYTSTGNISELTQSGFKTYYHYDKNNRLIREDNQKSNYTYIYKYDDDGNRTDKYIYDYTRNMTDDVLKTTPNQKYGYQYASGMRLMGDGKTNGYRYDSDGNPTYYRGHNLTWSMGQLISYAGVDISYDGYGRRLTKKGITYTYDSNNRLIKQSNGLEFFYDDSGVIGFKYGGKLYTYLKDIQGNIIGIVDNLNTLIAKYEYDAWGNFTVYDGTGKVVGSSETIYSSTTAIWNINPFRYRGYYYDIETGLYYLLNRYYDPQTGRFISLDNSSYADPETINGLNLYLYCNNNPVMNVDPTGCWVLSAILAGILIGGGAIIGGISAAVRGENIVAGIFEGAFIGGLLTCSILMSFYGIGLLSSSKILGSLLTLGGFVSAFSLGQNIDKQISQGNGFGNLNNTQMFESWGKGVFVGGLLGATSGVFSIIGSYYANLIGLAGDFSGKLLELIELAGGGVGGLAGGYLINSLFTNNGVFNNKIPTWMATLLKLLGKI